MNACTMFCDCHHQHKEDSQPQIDVAEASCSKRPCIWTDNCHFLVTAEVLDHVVVERALAMDSFRSFDECLCIITSVSISLIAPLAS